MSLSLTLSVYQQAVNKKVQICRVRLRLFGTLTCLGPETLTQEGTEPRPTLGECRSGQPGGAPPWASWRTAPPEALSLLDHRQQQSQRALSFHLPFMVGRMATQRKEGMKTVQLALLPVGCMHIPGFT